MKRISYGQAVIGTDERIGDLLLQYATLLARIGSADTVTIPSRIGTGAVEPLSVLVGPASQITAWSDDEPFDGETGDAVADLERRIAAASGADPADGDPGPGAIDEFDDLA